MKLPKWICKLLYKLNILGISKLAELNGCWVETMMEYLEKVNMQDYQKLLVENDKLKNKISSLKSEIHELNQTMLPKILTDEERKRKWVLLYEDDEA